MSGSAVFTKHRIGRSSRRRRCLPAVLVAGVLALGFASAPAALADVGTPSTLSLPSGDVLNSVSCATPTACIAVGHNASNVGIVVRIVNGSLSSDLVVASTYDLRSVSCTAGLPLTCLAVGHSGSCANDLASCQGVVVPITNGDPGQVFDAPVAYQLNGVSCPTSGFCLAVGVDGGSDGVFITDTNGQIAKNAVLPYSGGLLSVSCTSQTNCMAVGGSVIPWSNGAPGTPQYLESQFGPYGSLNTLASVTCFSGSNCIAVGDAQETDYWGDAFVDQVGYVVPITNGVVGAASTTSVGDPNGYLDGRLLGVSCPYSGYCLAVGQANAGGGGISSITNGVANADSSGLPINANSAACSMSSCVVVGDGVTTVPFTATTSMTLAASANPAFAGAAETLTAKVNLPAGGPTPTGAVTFTVDNGSYSATLGTQSITASGVEQIVTTGLRPGVNYVSASYAGDSHYGASVATHPPEINASVATSALTLTSSANPTTAGDPVTFTAYVQPSAGGAEPTGAVTFTDAGTGATLGVAPLGSTGTATLTTSSLPPGSHTIAASYPGDANVSSSSGTLAQAINPYVPTVTLTPSVNPASNGQDVTLDLSVTGPSGVPSPTGTVTVRENQSQLVLGTPTLNASGTASVHTSALSVGRHVITLVFPGDSLYAPSTAAITVTVTAAPTGVVAERGSYALNGIGCEGTGQCMAVGFGLDPTSNTLAGVLVHEDGDRVGAPGIVPGTSNLFGLACATSTFCVAVGQVTDNSGTTGVVVPISNDVPGAAEMIPSSLRLDSVACPSSNNCIAAGFDAEGTGLVVPIGLGGPGRVQKVDPGILLNGIACQSDTACVAVGEDAPHGRGAVVPISNGIPGAAQDVQATGMLNAVTCATSSSCTAVGQNDQASVGVLVSIGLGTIGSVSTDPGTVNLLGIDCASATSCTTVGQQPGALEGVISDFGSGRGYSNSLIPGTYEFHGVACDTSTTCTAVGRNVGQGVLVPTTVSSGSAPIQTMTLTRLSLGSSKSPSVLGQEVTFTATLTPPASGATPTGTVTFTDTTTGSTLGTVALDSSNKAAVTASLALGSHVIQAAYSGDTNDNPSATTFTQTVVPIAVTTSAMSDPVDKAFSATLSALGGTKPYVWKLVSGALPNGLSLTSAGVLSGTPTTIATTSFTVQVTDSAKPAHTATGTITFTVSPMTVATTTLPAAPIGRSYSKNLLTSGGKAIFHWTITSGHLPPGLVMSSAGAVTGTPSAVGTFSFGVKVSDSAGHTATGTVTIVVTPLTITTSSLPNGKVKTAYSAKITVSGGKGTLVFTKTGTLPPGITMSSTGAFSGTPTTSGTWTFTVYVHDSASPQNTASRQLAITVASNVT